MKTNQTCSSARGCTAKAHWLACPEWEEMDNSDLYDFFDIQPAATVGRYYVDDLYDEVRKDRSR